MAKNFKKHKKSVMDLLNENPQEQEKKKMIRVPEIEYKFLKSQNKELLEQNKALQQELRKSARGIIGTLNSLGKKGLGNVHTV